MFTILIICDPVTMWESHEHDDCLHACNKQGLASIEQSSVTIKAAAIKLNIRY